MPAKTPEQRRAYDGVRRRPKRVKLRLTEDEAQRDTQRRDAPLGGALRRARLYHSADRYGNYGKTCCDSSELLIAGGYV
jgi:hypothetical protein